MEPGQPAASRAAPTGSRLSGTLCLAFLSGQRDPNEVWIHLGQKKKEKEMRDLTTKQRREFNSFSVFIYNDSLYCPVNPRSVSGRWAHDVWSHFGSRQIHGDTFTSEERMPSARLSVQLGPTVCEIVNSCVFVVLGFFLNSNISAFCEPPSKSDTCATNSLSPPACCYKVQFNAPLSADLQFAIMLFCFVFLKSQAIFFFLLFYQSVLCLNSFFYVANFLSGLLDQQTHRSRAFSAPEPP